MKSEQVYRLVIIGAGASGLAAALAAAENGLPTSELLLVEKEEKPGRKILASGNGRCNLSHLPPYEGHYHSHRPDLIRRDLLEFDSVGFFRGRGLPLRQDECGRLYPHNEQALAVWRFFTDRLTQYGIQPLCGIEIVKIEKRKATYVLVDQKGTIYQTEAFILACGSSAAPDLGGTSRGAELLQGLKQEIHPFRPVLSPLELEASSRFLKLAKGCRIKGTGTIIGAGADPITEEGEFLFTEYGLSGIAAMQLSLRIEAAWARQRTGTQKRYPLEIRLDFFADHTLEQLLAVLEANRRRLPHVSGDVFLRSFLPDKLAQALLAEPGMQYKDCHKLALKLKSWPFRIQGVRDFSQAQLAFGGLDLAALKPNSAELIAHPKVYVCGELLDLAGDTGGYNLHFAFAGGWAAGREASRR